MTLGPGGIVAQPESINTTNIMAKALFSFISPTLHHLPGGTVLGITFIHPPGQELMYG
jgi:hypothetical protein